MMTYKKDCKYLEHGLKTNIHTHLHRASKPEFHRNKLSINAVVYSIKN